MTSLIPKVLATTAFAMVLGVGALAQPASAARIAYNGTTAYVGEPTPTCVYYDVWNRLDVRVPAPNIYSPDVTAGGGNDATWVRYLLYVADRYGNIVQTTGYSAWAVAYDNQPANFNGVIPYLLTNIPEYSKIIVGVEWWNATSLTGVALHRVDRYQLISGGMGPYGVLDSCSKWMWRP